MVLDVDYEVHSALAEGSFGKVYKATHKKTGDPVAVKRIKLGCANWDEAVRSLELQALTALRHPFVVKLREVIRSKTDGSLYYIFEYIDSDLCRLVKAKPNGLEEPSAQELARQIYSGLSHMHQCSFFHRDLKPENVLYDTARNMIRIADLGQARSLRARPPFTDYVGTRWYRAPECLLRDRNYSSPVDIWASGLIVSELLRGSPVFCGTSSIDQLHKIFLVLGQPLDDWQEFKALSHGMRFRAPERSGYGLQHLIPQASAQAIAFLSEVLVLNPRRRPTAKMCLEHLYFQSLLPMDIEPLLTHRGHRDSGPRDYGEPEIGNESPVADRPSLKRVETDEFEEFDAELDRILGNSEDRLHLDIEGSSKASCSSFRDSEGCRGAQASLTSRSPWSLDEVRRLRSAVSRARRRCARGDQAFWQQVSTLLGGSRGARDCRDRYSREVATSRQNPRDFEPEWFAAPEVSLTSSSGSTANGGATDSRPYLEFKDSAFRALSERLDYGMRERLQS